MTAPAAEPAARLAAQARRLLDDLRYLTLATADADGRPWATPVFFGHRDHRVFSWVSSPAARHSRNIAARPEVGLTVYDSTVPIGGAEAVYVEAHAALVPAEELADALDPYQSRLPATSRMGIDELSGAGPLRLYRAVAVEHSVLVRGRDPLNETGVDARRVVDLGT